MCSALVPSLMLQRRVCPQAEWKGFFQAQTCEIDNQYPQLRECGFKSPLTLHEPPVSTDCQPSSLHTDAPLELI